SQLQQRATRSRRASRSQAKDKRAGRGSAARPLTQPALATALAAASLLLAAGSGGCGDDESLATAASQGGGQGGAAGMAASSTGAAGGSGGAPSCSDDPSLCQAQTPVCHEGSCVECAPGDDALCGGQRPYCNPETLSCEACRYHAHW